MSFEDELTNHIDAKVPAVYVETTEWERFDAALQAALGKAKGNKKLNHWNPLEGLDGDENIDFATLIDKIHEGVNWHITVIEHADRFFDDQDVCIRFAVLLKRLREKGHQIIVVASSLNLPSVIGKEFSILDFPLPDRGDIRTILENTDLPEDRKDTANEILDSVRGLGTTEIRNAFAKVAAGYEKVTAEEIVHLVAEKEQIIRKSGYLEYIKSDISERDIGGLENLKGWLKTRKIAFGAKAREHKLQAPKGVLLLGIPGTGKSLSAKSVANIWKMPLLRLDMARIFGGLVGESESNMRHTIKVAESMEPCILWIDEIEKGLSGGQDGERDGGTSARVFGTFLTWMQEKRKEIFIFATANDISKLPPELLRKGRFDEIFFVDLPDSAARKKIFEIHLKSRNQSAVPSDELLAKTEGFSGAEIETIVNEAHFMSHKENPKNPLINAQNLIDATKEIVPLSKTMYETIGELREWAKVRCRSASPGEPPQLPSAQRGPKLPQEETNIFIKQANPKE